MVLPLSDVREYLSAQSNPQRSGRRIASILAEHLRAAAVRWVIIDDYHEMDESREVEELVDVLRQHAQCRFIVASRNRPGWASARGIVYGEIAELARDELAMTDAEARELLGGAKSSADLAKRADGWPAVLALAADVKGIAPPDSVLPSALHGYLAQELFQRVPADVQDQLVLLALLPTLTPSAIEESLGVNDGALLIQTATDLGFVSPHEPATFHPLLQEFLLEKLSERKDARARVHEAVQHLVREKQWDWALELVSRFSCDDLIEPVLRSASNHSLETAKLPHLHLSQGEFVFAQRSRRRWLTWSRPRSRYVTGT